jgi:mannose-6-phosphate isomerase-like protein (cupin superfamily)
MGNKENKYYIRDKFTLPSEIEKRPWGKFEILLDNNNCKVKQITVNPGGRLSHQYHHHRSEVWTIVSGVATITLDDKISHYIYGETVLIPQGAKHRVENKDLDDLIFIEVQHGSSFDETDIIRIEDDYNRK